MDKHYGHIIEKVIRRNGFSISDLARQLKVNRRSFYNWFEQKDLKPEIIYRIIAVMEHDFREDFPELFTEEEFKKLNATPNPSAANEIQDEQEVTNWKNKYIDLLEKYNELLITEISKKED